MLTIHTLDVKPKIVVTDLFMQFRNVIRSSLGDVEIVADKYHFVRQVEWMIGLSTLFRTIFIRSFFYILQVFYNLVIHEYECYCTNSHNQINLFLALQNF